LGRFVSDEDLASHDQKHLNLEWNIAVLIRDAFGIAIGNPDGITYKQSMTAAMKLAPDIFNPSRSLLLRQEESDNARYYREKASLLTKRDGREITPVELIEREIKQEEEILGSDTRLIQKNIDKLIRVKNEFDKREYEENELIIRDAQLGLGLPDFGKGDRFYDFKVSQDRFMRIRMLHPTKADKETGADLLYEHYSHNKRMVRVAAIQYKIWEPPDSLYASQSNVRAQLETLKKVFCDNNLCKVAVGSTSNFYRLPHCAAFLRPTDKLQSKTARLASTGYHLPVCRVATMWKPSQQGKPMLTVEDVRAEAISHQVFDDLFNADKLGSDWIATKDLEQLYQQYKVLDRNDRIIFQCQAVAANPNAA